MAIVLCKECKASISSSATKCPQCGAKMPKKTSLLTWFLGAAICAIVVIARDPSADKSDVVSKPNGTLTAPRPAWKYPAENDRMTGKPTKQASVDSVNSLALGWPYHGKNFGSILISAKAGQETTVLVSLEKGQTMCRSFDTSCKIEVKFDNAQPIRFSGQSPSDGSSNYFFLSPTQKFIAEAKKAQSITLSFDVYQNGIQFLEFSGGQLRW